MRALTRANVPLLASSDVSIGPARLRHRSFPTGKRNFFRRYQGEILELSLILEDDFPDPELILTTDINNRWGEWYDLRFARRDKKNFSLRIPLRRPGVFRFKVKYSTDGGKSLHWLRGHYSYLLVDPAGAKVIRMYTLIPTVSGNISQWMKELEHIKDLGCDTVHCLPITTLDVSESPYSAHDLFSVDPSYLDPTLPGNSLDQLEMFVRKARELELRLCFDLVINHIGVHSSLVQARPDWCVHDEESPDGLKRAGCWHMDEWISWEDLVLINYDHPARKVRAEIRAYMKQYVLFWAHYANYTGGMIRYDNLHSSHEEFIHEITLALQDKYPDVMVLAEFFTSEEVFLDKVPHWSLNLLQANQWEYAFSPELRDYLRHVHERGAQLKYLFSITTHDTETPTKRFGDVQSTRPRYALCALMTTGQTGLVQGVEYGLPEKINFIGRNQTVNFDTGYDFTEFIRSINQLLAQYPVFQQAGNLRFVDEDHGAIIGALRHTDDPSLDEMLVFVNMDPFNPHSYEFDLKRHHLKAAGFEPSFLIGALDTLHQGAYRLTLEPGGVGVLRLLK